jgi:2-polyprenyl-6-hydroxyphenyl methylase/3-demethylubiquinone-9 3-methyltransferase
MPPTSHSAGADVRFAFGANWQGFVRAGIAPGQVATAAASLRRLLGCEDLRGCVFLDVGCGSGLSSLAALELGAARVVSFDADASAVDAALELRRHYGGAARWEVRHGSILDPAFVAALPPADVVYAWGVLHHTGAMWQAIDNTAGQLAPSGRLAIAIYNEVNSPFGGSRQWWVIKRWYNRAPPALRLLLEQAYMAQRALRDLVVLRDPRRRWRDDDRPRGMRYRHDVRDWLGGFPYEYASAAAVLEYVRGKFGFGLCYLATRSGHQCNELTFRRPSR